MNLFDNIEEAAAEAEEINKAEAAQHKAIEEAAELAAVTVYPTAEKVEIENYPYGRLRTSCFFGAEWKPGKGYRTTKQTINPKTGRINKPKKSTYNPFMLMVQNNHTKRVEYISARWYDVKDNKQLLSYCDIYFRLLTAEQIEDIALYIIAMMKIDFKAALMYSVRPEHHKPAIEHLKNCYKEPINILADIAKNKVNRFGEVLNKLDFEKIDQVKDENYNPFTEAASKPINILDMVKK